MVATMQQEDSELKSKMGSLETNVGNLNVSNVDLSPRLSSLNTEIRLLETIHMQDKLKISLDISRIKDQAAAAPKLNLSRDVVSFHAQLGRNTAGQPGQPLVLSVVYNTTGIFTAPSDGVYFFIASTGSYNRTHDTYLELVVDGEELSMAFVHNNSVAGEVATCHGVANLTAGQRVWMRSMLDGYYNYADTFFTGFLIN